MTHDALFARITLLMYRRTSAGKYLHLSVMLQKVHACVISPDHVHIGSWANYESLWSKLVLYHSRTLLLFIDWFIDSLMIWTVASISKLEKSQKLISTWFYISFWRILSLSSEIYLCDHVTSPIAIYGHYHQIAKSYWLYMMFIPFWLISVVMCCLLLHIWQLHQLAK